jgi:hypothetical protein
MNNEFISYEQALALKELGFNEPCFAHFVKYYNEIKCILDSDDFDQWWTNNSDNLECKAPLYQQVFRWFREKYRINPIITCYSELGNAWKYHIPNEDGEQGFNTYEVAEITCLNKLIEIIKNK